MALPDHPVEVKLTIQEGADGVDDDLSNPIARATSRLLNEGQPFSCLHASIFNPRSDHGLRWLGVFVWSAGQRVIFFPGFVAKQDVLSTASSQRPAPVEKEFQTDHLTLGSDLRTWHITTAGRARREGPFRTRDLGNGHVFWCGMHVASPNCMRVLRKETLAMRGDAPVFRAGT